MQLMLSKVKEVEAGGVPDEHLAQQLGLILKSMSVLAGGGALCGFIAGYLTTVRNPPLSGPPQNMRTCVCLCASSWGIGDMRRHASHSTQTRSAAGASLRSGCTGQVSGPSPHR